MDSQCASSVMGSSAASSRSSVDSVQPFEFRTYVSSDKQTVYQKLLDQDLDDKDLDVHTVLKRKFPSLDSKWRKKVPSILDKDYGNEDEDLSRLTFRQWLRCRESGTRPNWNRHSHFVCAVFSFNFGLENAILFPIEASDHGGGIFIIIYTICLFCFGFPLFVLELSLAQYCGKSSTNCWQLAPLFKGFGFAMMLLSLISATYGNSILVFILHYLYNSISTHPQLPWATCNNFWNKDPCVSDLQPRDCGADLQKYSDGTCRNREYNTTLRIHNFTQFMEYHSHSFPADNYLENYIMSSPRLRENFFLGCLLMFLITTLSLLIPNKSFYGKTASISFAIKLVLIFILLINVMLSDSGITDADAMFVTNDIGPFFDWETWFHAFKLVCQSLALGLGCLHMFASYNTVHTDIIGSAFVLCVGDLLASIVSGTVIMSYISNLAQHIDETRVSDLVHTWTGHESFVEVALVIVPTAITLQSSTRLVTFIYFAFLFSLAFDCQLGYVKTLAVGILDNVDKPYNGLRLVTTLLVCFVVFLLSVIILNFGGMLAVEIFMKNSGYINAWVVCLGELLAVLVYGIQNFANDIAYIVGLKVLSNCIRWSTIKWFFILFWALICPVIVVTCIVHEMILFLGRDTTAIYFLGAIETLIIACIIGTVAVLMYRKQGTFVQKFFYLVKGSHPRKCYVNRPKKKERKLVDFELIER